MTASRIIKLEAPKKGCLTLADIESFVKNAREAGATAVEEISGSTAGWGMKLGEISVRIPFQSGESPQEHQKWNVARAEKSPTHLFTDAA